MSNDKTRCEPCEQDFQNNIDRIIREGRAPKGSEHDAHEKELKAAFGADDRNRSKNPTTASTASEQTSAQSGSKGYPLGDMPNPDRR